jgi:nucleotide-binding universal stress UspA family protein
MYESILFPTDGSEHSRRVFDHALDIAATRGATLHVLSVVDNRSFLTLDDEKVDAVRAELSANAHEAVDNVAGTARDRGVGTETRVEVGSPADRIVSYVTETGVDLVVMGTNAGDYERNVVGSVSQRVVERSPAPVLTVGPETRSDA